MTEGNRNQRLGVLPRLLVLVGLGVLLALVAALPAQAATPAQIVLLGTDPAYSQVTVNRPDGTPSGLTAPGQFQLQVTPAGGTPVVRQAFCVDTFNPIGENTPYQVSLQTASDDPTLASPTFTEAGWLMQEADTLIAAAANPSLEAGAIQTAIWMILGQADQTTPTSDATLNARALQVRALAAGKRFAGPVGISAAAASTCAGGPGTTLTVTGTPGATASLVVTSGQGTLSASQVTFSAAGTATVGLTSATAGTVQVSVASNGVEVTRATRLTASGAPQETSFVVPRTYNGTVSVTFTNCAQGASVRPSGIVRPAGRPTLKVTKVAPKQLKSGAQVRYVITVTNTSRTVARNVVVSDRVPSGMAFLTSTKRPNQLGKRVVWQVGTLRPGQTRTFTVTLRAPTGLVGSRTNTVVASATRARTVTAAATTRFTRVSQQRIPAVTG